MKAICVTTASACWDRRRRRILSGSRILRQPDRSFGARGFMPASFAKIHQLWPASQASLMDAMVLGEESFLRNATRTEFQRSGTYHVLVVSGMNLSILAVAIFWTLRQFRLDPAVAAIATVAVSFAYAFVVGVGPPVWRAALMLAIYLGARLLYRGRNMMNAIGAAAHWRSDCRPACPVWREFSADVSGGLHHRGHRLAASRTQTLPYARGLRLLQADQLRLARRAAGGAIRARPANDRGKVVDDSSATA